MAWRKPYDLQHCLTGGEILDLYVSPECRAGVWHPPWSALSRQRFCGGWDLCAGPGRRHRAAQRLYARLAMCFPGADCAVGGRAFRRLAELAGRSARVVAQFLPEKSRNYEP